MSAEFHYDEHRNIIEGPKPDDVATDDERIATLDANGNALSDGDTVVAIKGLPVKGGTDIKKGDKFTNITLQDDDHTHVSARSKVNGKIFLKTEYFKKAG